MQAVCLFVAEALIGVVTEANAQGDQFRLHAVVFGVCVILVHTTARRHVQTLVITIGEAHHVNLEAQSFLFALIGRALPDDLLWNWRIGNDAASFCQLLKVHWLPQTFFVQVPPPLR